MGNIITYLSFVGTGIGLLVAVTVVYILITPYREFHLIQQGNRAAAISLGGAMAGFGLVLQSAAANTGRVYDMALWAVVALALQLVAFVVVTFLLRGFTEAVEADKESYGIALAAISIAVALINAGAIGN